MNATTLPILDLARYADPADKAAFLADLRHAARDIGFFYLINHGVDDALQYEVQRQSQRFFALDEAQKQQVAMIHSPHFRGYNRAASELTRGQPDWREQFDMLVGFLAVEPVKGILRELQGFGKSAQQADAHLGHLLLPVK